MWETCLNVSMKRWVAIKLWAWLFWEGVVWTGAMLSAVLCQGPCRRCSFWKPGGVFYIWVSSLVRPLCKKIVGAGILGARGTNFLLVFEQNEMMTCPPEFGYLLLLWVLIFLDCTPQINLLEFLFHWEAVGSDFKKVLQISWNSFIKCKFCLIKTRLYFNNCVIIRYLECLAQCIAGYLHDGQLICKYCKCLMDITFSSLITQVRGSGLPG